MRPKVFIGSSQEAYDKGIAEKLLGKLNCWCDAQLWPNIFSWSETTIVCLEKNLPMFNAYVFILTPDDVYTTRNQTYVSARDNLLFEIGLTMGLKKRENTFIIKQKCDEATGQIKLPSDILGVNYGEFSYTKDRKDTEFENISNRIKNEYFANNPESVNTMAEELYKEKVKDLSEDIGKPIKDIQKNIENIEKTLKNDIAVLSGAQKSGIVNIFPNRYETITGVSLNDCIKKEFEDTQSQICILGISLGDYFLDRGVMHQYFMELIKKHYSKTNDKKKDAKEQPPKIRALIVDPKCEALIERAFWEAGPEYCQNAKAYTDSTTYIETDGAARIAHRLQKKYNNTLEVRTYTQAPTCFLLLTGKYAFVENYTYASRGSSCPNIQIVEGSLYKLYKKHFDNIWESAAPIDKYNPSEQIDRSLFDVYEQRIRNSVFSD